MTFVNERQRNRLHAHCCNVCKVLLSSLSCSLALSPSNITRIFTFNSSVIIAIAYKSWFLFCFFPFHSFSNGYFLPCIHLSTYSEPKTTHQMPHSHKHWIWTYRVQKKMRDFGVYRWIFRHIYFTSVAQRFVHNCYFGKWIFVFFVISRFVQFLPSKIIHEIRLHFTNFQFSWLNRKQNIQCEMCLHWTKIKYEIKQCVLASLVWDIFWGRLTHTLQQFSSLISFLGISRLSGTINWKSSFIFVPFLFLRFLF